VGILAQAGVDFMKQFRPQLADNNLFGLLMYIVT
jgi:hypothetical protein